MLVASEAEEKSSWFYERWMVMRRFQRIILFIFCSFVFSTSVASAQIVQLSDLGAEQFYQGLEIIAGQLHESSELGDLVHIGIDPPDSPYDTYITVWDGNMIYILNFPTPNFQAIPVHICSERQTSPTVNFSRVLCFPRTGRPAACRTAS
ncbi:MAG: hypothetical protein MR698_07290, partial [Selenomonas sp.]|nr:hypothetical protein [Selenomonas sp.]